MRLSLPAALCLASTVASFAVDDHPWRAPSSSDHRSPCPLLNSLANHGFLPRSGRNITSEELIGALSASINLDPSVAEGPTALALTTSKTGNPDTFDLDNLDQHGVIEHDASLSRADTVFGDNSSLNLTIWNETKSFFDGETISVSEAGKARIARIRSSAAINPQFSLLEGDQQSSLFETAFYLIVFGNGTEARTSWVNIFFEQERLPYAEGYTPAATPIMIETLLDVAGKVAAVP
ncbi:Chloroperoxidase [Lasiosphaeria hispida]|uniref:Chloroperoxidase n=1 Tax=Lasiosphaeria hispida TaxID=260671 RepID=A0AAJ0HGL4_9PEZI|nr:Chloroperoxidase [Lasiosphaeria hispida]